MMSKKQSKIPKKSISILKQFQIEASEGPIIKELNDASNQQLIDIQGTDEEFSPWIPTFQKIQKNDIYQLGGSRSQNNPTFHSQQTNQVGLPLREYQQNRSRGFDTVTCSKYGAVKFPTMEKRQRVICALKTKSLELKKFPAFYSSKEKPILKPAKKFFSERRIFKVELKTTVLPKVKTEKHFQIENRMANAFPTKTIHEKGEKILELAKIQQHEITKLLMKKCIFRR